MRYLLIFLLLFSVNAEAATQLKKTVMPSGGDYTSLEACMNANEFNLTNGSVKIFSGSYTGTLTAGDTVTLYRGGSSQSVTGTVNQVKTTTLFVTAISNTGFTFQANDEWRKDGSNLFTMSNAGDTVYFDVEIDGTWSSADTTAVVVHNYTTDATRYINIYTTAGCRHDGKYNTGKYRIEVSADGGVVFNIQSANVTITGLQIFNTTTGTSNFTKGVNFESSYSTADKCILKSNCASTNIYCGAFYAYSGSTNGIVKNSVIIGVSSAAAVFDTPWNAPTYIQLLNCTLLGNRSGNSVITETNAGAYYKSTIKNCYAVNAGSGADLATGGGMGVTTCATSDGSLSTATVAYTTDTFTNVTAGSEDFHLVAGSGLLNVGTDLSATFTDDIDGDTRPTGASSWDIGADEYVAAGGATASLPQNTFGNGIGQGIGRGMR